MASAGADRRGRAVLTLILPAYNEARRLPASLASCAEFFLERAVSAEVIVCDDGSTDGTGAAFARAVETLPRLGLRYRYLDLPHRGKGAAVRAGVAEAAGDPVVFLDADLTIPVELLDRFTTALAEGADIAVASRYVAGSRVARPWWRTLMGQVFRACVHAVIPIDVQDTQCGGKMYTAEAAKDLFARSTLDGFAFDAEVLFLARRRGYRVTEVAFELHQEGPTTVAFLRDAPRMFRDLFRIRWNAARGGYGPRTVLR
ncbi:MAG TPA: glycosyltransferase [Candidatus Saccharimonadales bacterium]|nr:glycosyltransferase [Candidatus Saccharimonadales bacterium]